jgi:hypothetical protein
LRIQKKIQVSDRAVEPFAELSLQAISQLVGDDHLKLDLLGQAGVEQVFQWSLEKEGLITMDCSDEAMQLFLTLFDANTKRLEYVRENGGEAGRTYACNMARYPRNTLSLAMSLCMIRRAHMHIAWQNDLDSELYSMDGVVLSEEEICIPRIELCDMEAAINVTTAGTQVFRTQVSREIKTKTFFSFSNSHYMYVTSISKTDTVHLFHEYHVVGFFPLITYLCK